MEEQVNIFDLLSDEDAAEYQAIKSNDWKWSFKDYPEKNGIQVFSCFACGGGSTMGYKLAGCNVLGCVEIDPKMNEIYVANHHPRFNYLMDIRDFNNLDNLPDELYHLDILDGSPPCSCFSMAGEREHSWGKEKKFREGQKEQTLDDLPFVFIKTINKLRPKCAIIENVEGMLIGNAYTYVKQIHKELKAIGYDVRHYLLKGEFMGIPQTRHRVFFIAVRHDINFDFEKLNLKFNFAPVTYGEIKSGELIPLKQGTIYYNITKHAIYSDKSIADTRVRLGEKASSFQAYYIRDNEVMPTLRSAPEIIDIKELAHVSKETLINAQTFPQDYNFINNTVSNIGYVCGMSVPPVMIKRLVERLIQTNIFS